MGIFEGQKWAKNMVAIEGKISGPSADLVSRGMVCDRRTKKVLFQSTFLARFRADLLGRIGDPGQKVWTISIWIGQKWRFLDQKWVKNWLFFANFLWVAIFCDFSQFFREFFRDFLRDFFHDFSRENRRDSTRKISCRNFARTASPIFAR